ncbi:MAG: cation transporter [Verrucomicrobia bacterium]|nr:cation transporter [Verrucomicrobiota bacterium]
MLTNGVLAAVKLAAGILGQSYALIADAIESVMDVFSSLIVWRGMVVANRPADADHPYGHGRAETLAATAVAVMLLAAAAVILYQAVREILEPHGTPAPFTLFVLLGVVLVKEGLYRFVSGVGSEIESEAVQTDAWHHRSDAITSAAAALGISISLVGGPRFASADEWAAIFASVIIAWNGWRLLRPLAKELMEAEPPGNLIEQARRVAVGVSGVKGVEKCFGRKMGYAYFLEMHVEVDGVMTVRDAHQVAHDVKDAIQGALPRVNNVTVHIEPFGETQQ